MSGTELAQAVNVSVPTLHRLLRELGEEIVGAGQARRRRYSLRRALRGNDQAMPLYQIDNDGRAMRFGRLRLIYPQGAHLPFVTSRWPVPEYSRDGWWEGLPYPFYDMRPQGYMGRRFADVEHHHFQVSPNPDDWSDDDIVFVLSQSGWDTSGNLILGDRALELWQAQKLSSSVPIRPRGLREHYAQLAQRSIEHGVHGSSTAGEFPKFSALRELAGSATAHVLVKFSGKGNSAAVRRWADLLICEHLAHESMSLLPNVASARSRILTHGGGRTFLEVERFDRHGMHGRSGLVSLGTIDAAFLGSGTTDWSRAAYQLEAHGLIDIDDRTRIELLWWFGRLIGNADMHSGNLSFMPDTRFVLAPAYDMLPMLYAPLPGGEVPTRQFEPQLPSPAARPIWNASAAAAISFWKLASRDARISRGFRNICGMNAHRLEEVAARA